MADLSFFNENPSFLYEGANPALFEYLDGISLNRSPKQIHSNTKGLRDAILDQNTTISNLQQALTLLTGTDVDFSHQNKKDFEFSSKIFGALLSVFNYDVNTYVAGTYDYYDVVKKDSNYYLSMTSQNTTEPENTQNWVKMPINDFLINGNKTKILLKGLPSSEIQNYSSITNEVLVDTDTKEIYWSENNSLIKIGGGGSIDKLEDTSIHNPASGETLFFNGAKWVNMPSVLMNEAYGFSILNESFVSEIQGSFEYSIQNSFNDLLFVFNNNLLLNPDLYSLDKDNNKITFVNLEQGDKITLTLNKGGVIYSGSLTTKIETIQAIEDTNLYDLQTQCNKIVCVFLNNTLIDSSKYSLSDNRIIFDTSISDNFIQNDIINVLLETGSIKKSVINGRIKTSNTKTYNLPFYQMNNGGLFLYLNGLFLVQGIDYEEVSATSIELTTQPQIDSNLDYRIILI